MTLEVSRAVPSQRGRRGPHGTTRSFRGPSLPSTAPPRTGNLEGMLTALVVPREPRRVTSGASHVGGHAGRPRSRLTGVSLCTGLLLASLIGCSSDGGGNGTFAVGPHPALPTVVDNGGGILTAPEIVTVTFDPSLYTNATVPPAATMLSDLGTFDDTITATAWWQTVTKDYCDPQLGCIGPGSAGPHVAIAQAPAGDGTTTCGAQPCYTDTASGGPASLKTYIAGLLSAGTLPAPTAQTLYVMYFPSSVVINVDGSLSCDVIGAYHDSLPVGSLDVPYAVVPLCDPEPAASGTPELTVEQTATVAASHEIVEATTDPHGGEGVPNDPSSTQHLGFYLTGSDAQSQAWALLGGEVADLCVDILGMGQDRYTEGNFIYQRIWSNSSAAASHDPCVPVPAGEVYFNAAPAPAGDEALTVGVGATASLRVDAFSDAPAPSWQVFAADIGTGTASGAILTFTPSKRLPAMANNDQSLPFSVTLTGQPPVPTGAPAGSAGVEPYFVVSEVTGGAIHLWPAFIVSAQ